MKKFLNILLPEGFIICFISLLFLYSGKCVELAQNGLLIWFQKMIPSLFPFMIISGFLVRSGLSINLGTLLQPFLGSVFRLPPHMLYVIFMGFLCGFPMGAKIIADMLEQKQITSKEGEFLLAFCNNIGPLYLLGYVIPLFKWNDYMKVFTLMYGVPLLYGIFLRYFTKYKNITTKTNTLLNHSQSTGYISELSVSLSFAIEQITLLGGCMIFFNCLQIFPLLLTTYTSKFANNFALSFFLQGILCSLTEIGGGLSRLAQHQTAPFSLTDTLLLPLVLSLLTFGGISCFFQTYLILKKTGLKITAYLKHKLIQSILIFIFYSLY